MNNKKSNNKSNNKSKSKPSKPKKQLSGQNRFLAPSILRPFPNHLLIR
jgi:hypothetical protein